MVEVRVHRLAHAVDLPLYASDGAAGADLHSAAPGPVTLAPGERAAVATGLVLELPRSHEAQVRPRSGLALRHGLTVANAPGTIDSDYRGEVHVLLVNLGAEPVTINRGDRIAQLVVAPVTRATFVDVDELAPSMRGPGGFGSTGR
jgi:dUTP pyrophosphatase